MTTLGNKGVMDADVKDIYEFLIAKRDSFIAKAIISPLPSTSVVVGTTLKINGNTSTPLNGVTYQWAVNPASGVTTTPGTDATQNVTFKFNTVGSYRITLTAKPTA